MYCYVGRDEGLAVGDFDPEAIRRKYRQPSIWKMYKPTDITMYDLIYEPYLGQESYAKPGTHALGLFVECFGKSTFGTVGLLRERKECSDC